MEKSKEEINASILKLKAGFKSNAKEREKYQEKRRQYLELIGEPAQSNSADLEAAAGRELFLAAPSMKKQKTAAGARGSDHDSSFQLLKSDDSRDKLEDLSENFDVFDIESESELSHYQMLDTMENDSTSAYKHEKSRSPSFLTTTASASTSMGDFKTGKVRTIFKHLLNRFIFSQFPFNLSPSRIF